MDNSQLKTLDVLSNFMVNVNRKTHVKDLFLCFGPMFSGKTTTAIKIIDAIRKINETTENNVFFKCINHSNDTRVINDCLSSHNIELNNKYECDKYVSLCNNDLLNQIQDNETTILLIDEAQFFHDLYKFVTMLFSSVPFLEKNILIFCFSLNSDFRRKPFGEAHLLIPFASHVEILKGKCHYCEKKSITSHLIHATNEDNNIIIGGSDKFIPLCNICYLKVI